MDNTSATGTSLGTKGKNFWNKFTTGGNALLDKIVAIENPTVHTSSEIDNSSIAKSGGMILIVIVLGIIAFFVIKKR